MDVDMIKNMSLVMPVTQQPQAVQRVQPQAETTGGQAQVNGQTQANGQANTPVDLDAGLSKLQNGGRSPEEKNAAAEREASNNMLKKAIESANNSLKDVNKALEYSVHQKTKRIMVKVIDTNTKEVIREIPPEKTLDMFVKVLELAGIMYDEKR